MRVALVGVIVSASGSLGATDRVQGAKGRETSATRAEQPGAPSASKSATPAVAPASRAPSETAASAPEVQAGPLSDDALPPPVPGPPPAVRPPLPQIARSATVPRAVRAGAPGEGTEGRPAVSPEGAPDARAPRTRDERASASVAPSERASASVAPSERASASVAPSESEAPVPQEEPSTAQDEPSASAAPLPEEAPPVRIRVTRASDARPPTADKKIEEPPRFVYDAGEWVRAVDYGWVWIPRDLTISSSGTESYAYLYTPLYGWSWYLAPWGPGPYRYGSWALNSTIGMAFWAQHMDDFRRRRAGGRNGASFRPPAFAPRDAGPRARVPTEGDGRRGRAADRPPLQPRGERARAGREADTQGRRSPMKGRGSR